MAINKKLIHFKTKENFNREVANNNILESSICFILDTKEIYTHGLLYDGSTFDPSNIEESIENIINTKVDKSDIYYFDVDVDSIEEGVITIEEYEKIKKCNLLILRVCVDEQILLAMGLVYKQDGIIFGVDTLVFSAINGDGNGNLVLTEIRFEPNENGNVTYSMLNTPYLFKTINGESILGEGDIIIEGGSSDTYYLELPLGEDGRCLSSGTLTQEQFEGISNCSILIVRTAYMDSEEVLGSEDITFNWKISQTEQYEGGSKAYAYSNLCPSLAEGCFVLYAITLIQYEGVCSYELAKKRFIVDSEITDPTDAFISTNSVYELDLSSGTTLENGLIVGNITEEEFSQITLSKNVIVNTGQFKFSLTQKCTFTDMLVFYGNIYYDGITQRLVLNVKVNGNECSYIAQLVPIVYELDLSSGTTGENGRITGNITEEEFNQIIEAESLAIKLGDHKVTFNQKSTSDRQGEYLFYGIYNDYEKEKIVLLIVLHNENDYIYEIRTQELGGSSAYSLVNHGTSDTTFTLTPNTFHVWDEVTTLDLDFGTETEGVANEYLFQFTSGATATTLSLPDNIKWTNEPNIETNKIYLISILNGLGSILAFTDKTFIKFYMNTGSLALEYTAEKGMSWREFIDSEYNNGDFTKLGEYYVSHRLNMVYDLGVVVLQTKLIVPDKFYNYMDT